VDSRYEIRDKLGQGGLGAVYRAYDKNLNREVAIKRPHPGDYSDDQQKVTRRLLKEAMALSAIQHPHIVTVYDCGADDEGPFVVMEILNGHSIEEMICEGTIVWEDFREFVLQTQDALIAAQNLGLVHRDLKPDNIMVVWLPSDKFQIKLVDFGMAEFVGPNSVEDMENSSDLMGSIYFMAPEHFENQPLAQPTDMYAMGAIYYYALTGEYPFRGDTALQVMAAHLQHHVTQMSELRPDLPQWACDWVMWHLERDMDQRPQNARESLKRFHGSERKTIEALLATGSIDLKAVKPGTGPVMKVNEESGLVQLSDALIENDFETIPSDDTPNVLPVRPSSGEDTDPNLSCIESEFKTTIGPTSSSNQASPTQAVTRQKSPLIIGLVAIIILLLMVIGFIITKI